MSTEKEKLLKETYNKFIQISLSDFPMEDMEEFIDQKITLNYDYLCCSSQLKRALRL